MYFPLFVCWSYGYTKANFPTWKLLQYQGKEEAQPIRMSTLAFLPSIQRLDPSRFLGTCLPSPGFGRVIAGILGKYPSTPPLQIIPLTQPKPKLHFSFSPPSESLEQAWLCTSFMCFTKDILFAVLLKTSSQSLWFVTAERAWETTWTASCARTTFSCGKKNNCGRKEWEISPL